MSSANLDGVSVVEYMENIVCQSASVLEVVLTVSGIASKVLVVGAEPSLSLPFGTGPLGNTPVGPAPGIATQASASTNLTLTASKVVLEEVTELLNVSAVFGGGMPANCQAAQAPAPAEASGVHEVVISVSDVVQSESGSSSGGVATPPPGSSKNAPSGLGISLTLLALAAVVRLCK